MISAVADGEQNAGCGRYEREQEWRKQEGERRKAQRAVWDAERKVKEEAWKARQAENFVEPYTDEIIKCDQLTAMLQKYAPAQAAAAAAPKTEIKMPEGVSILKKDRDAGMDGWFGGLGGSKKGKKGGGAKDKSAEKLSLSLDALASLQSISVAAPLTVGDVTAAIDKVKEKKVHYQELQKEEKSKREAKAAAEKEGVVEKDDKDAEGEGKEKKEEAKEMKEEDATDVADAEEETDAASTGETKAPEVKKAEANGVAKVEKKEEVEEEAADDAEEAKE